MHLTLAHYRYHLRKHWNQTFGGHPSEDEVFMALWLCYQETHRHYHTIQHLSECFAVLDQSGLEASLEVQLALWMHDVVYDTWVGNQNEAASAAWADRVMLVMGLSDAIRSRVRLLILATRDHTSHGSSAAPDMALLCDVDLSILGAAPERFDEYERQIRAEYNHVSDEDFSVGRRTFLNKLLYRSGGLYQTPWFRERFEAPARVNLTRSLAMLEKVAPTSLTE